MLICTECNREYEKGKFCMECGGPLRESRAGNKCPSCGAGLEGTENFCTECGTRLSAETSAAPEITYEELKKLYEEGRYEESYKRARKLADRDAWAQYMLGIHLYNGKGVKEDRKRADFWLQKAAEQGDADAKLFLGCCYAEGDGVREDKEEAVYWWQKAAEQGNAPAQYWLGACYYDGDGVREDEEKAAYWWQKAAEQGHEDALERLEEKNISIDFDENEAGGMAARMGKNASEEDVNNVKQNMNKMNRGPLAEVWDKVMALWEAFNNPKTPVSMKSIIIGGLIYMVCPFDLISDFIPFLGLTDDAGVIAMVFRQFMKLGAVAETDHDAKMKAIKEDIEKGEENYKVNVGLYD